MSALNMLLLCTGVGPLSSQVKPINTYWVYVQPLNARQYAMYCEW